jgi:hypothetical protein
MTTRFPSGDKTAAVPRTKVLPDGRLIAERMRSCDGARLRKKPSVAPTTSARARAVQRRSPLRTRTAAGIATPAREPPSEIQRSSLAKSPALCQRSSGSLVRHFRMAHSRAGGVRGAMVDRGAGSVPMMAATTLAVDLPSKARLPVDIS